MRDGAGGEPGGGIEECEAMRVLRVSPNCGGFNRNTQYQVLHTGIVAYTLTYLPGKNVPLRRTEKPLTKLSRLL